ncbi:LamG-like jellyroll fold domain-containing protein [Longispora urticae]
MQPSSPRASIVRLALAALLVSTLPVLGAAPAGAAPSAPSVPPTELADPSAASTAARRFQTRVGVADERTATTEVFANPDGTFTADIASQPVRVRRNGGWVPADPTLVRVADGSVTTKASAAALRLSGGGTGPLVVLERDGRELALTWPGTLPAPTLEGKTATYAEVLPGVDLKVRAEVEGFSEVLVVKNREAARNPALRTIRFGTRTSGLRLELGEAGSLRAVDDRGAGVFAASAPIMWDSPAPPLREHGRGQQAATAEPGGGEKESRHATMPMELGADSLTLVPDQALLSGPDTVYPVLIDPTVGAAGAGWCLLGGYNASWQDTEYWGGDGDNLAKVGYATGSYPAKYRSVFQYDLSGYGGWKMIKNAKFAVNSVDYVWNNPTAVTLHKTGTINGATNWNNHAGSWSGSLGQRDARTGQGLEWSVDQQAKDASLGYLALGMRTATEWTAGNWLRFNPANAYLSVTYNTRPGVPHTPRTEGKDCATPAFVGTRTPKLTAIASDGDPGASVRLDFEWWQGGAKVGGASAHNLADGWTGTVTTGQLTEGGTYTWRVGANDAQDDSGWSGWCTFTVDTVRPGLPTIASDGVFLENHDLSTGGVGQTGKFTLNDAGATDVVGFQWGWGSPVTFVPAANHKAELNLTPMAPNMQTLAVRSVDAAGNLSDIRKFEFDVLPGALEVGNWPLAEGSGSVGADTVPNNPHHLALSGSTTWAPALGPDSRSVGGPAALRFNGSTLGTAKTGTTVVDTSQSFSVSVWARPTVLTSSDSVPRTVLSTDSASSNYFAISTSADGKWRVWTRSDESSAGNAEVRGGAALVGVWSHVAASYDAATKALTLHVNGEQVGTVTLPAALNKATGPLALGRYQFMGNYSGFFAGDIAEVRAWQRQLAPDEIDYMARNAESQGQWSLGTNTEDLSGKSRHLTTAPGASLVDDALVLNGAGGHAKTTGPALRTDQSYSVAAWVKLDRKDPNDLTAVSQFGNRASAFWLQYRAGVDRWAIGAAVNDADNTAVTYALSDQSPRLRTWTHLVGQYDAGDRKLRLYVDGVLQAQVTDFTATWNATNPLYVGRGQYNAANPGYFPGAVDEVWVFAGVLPTIADGAVSIQSLSSEARTKTSRQASVGERADVLAYHERAGASAVVRMARTSNTQHGAPVELWTSTYVAATTRAASGDFNGDGHRDVALLRETGGNLKATVLTGQPDGSVVQGAEGAALIGLAAMDHAQLFAGDANADGRDDLYVVYRGDDLSFRIWTALAQPDGVSFAVAAAWHTQPPNSFNMAFSKWVSGDFNGDGAADLATFYDYGNGLTRMFVYRSTGIGLIQEVWWVSNTGTWDSARAQYTVGDLNGDGIDDVAAMYDYPGLTTGFYAFLGNGANGLSSLSRWFMSPAGTFDATKVKLVTGDYNLDGRADLTPMYNFGAYACLMGIDSTGDAFTPTWHNRRELDPSYAWTKLTLL